MHHSFLRLSTGGQARVGLPGVLRLCFGLVVGWLGVGNGPAFGADPREFRARATETDRFFAGNEVPRFRLEVAPADLEKLGRYRWNPGMDASERPSVPATVRVGDRVYTNVAVHSKGAAGSFRPIDDRPALTLNFDKLAPGQNFRGLRKLSLNNSVQDPTYVSEILCRELFLAAGVPTPRAAHAQVELNGRDLGVYVLVEGWDRDFLRRHFPKPDGNLYDGGFVREITDTLSLNAGDDPKNQSDREALVKAAQEPDPAKRVAALQGVLDLERFLGFVALDVLLWNWDGYAMNKNNWRLYHDVSRDRMVFMPHGLDQMFWKPEGPILPGMEGLVARSVIQVPDLRRRYLERVRELRHTVFDVAAMTNRVLQLAARVRPVLAAAGESEAREHERVVNDFCSSIARRAESVDRQLSHPLEPLRFDARATAPLTGWTSKTVFGRPRIVAEEGANAALHAGTTSGSSIATWQTSVWLEGGRYRFEGRIRTRGLTGDPGDPRAGANLRPRTAGPQPGVTGDADWREVGTDVEVADGLAEVTLLCEFRGATGEAWFDTSSLRLRRVGDAPPAERRERFGPPR